MVLLVSLYIFEFGRSIQISPIHKHFFAGNCLSFSCFLRIFPIKTAADRREEMELNWLLQITWAYTAKVCWQTDTWGAIRWGKRKRQTHRYKMYLSISSSSVRGDVMWKSWKEMVKMRHVSLLSQRPHTDGLPLAGSEAAVCLSGFGADTIGWGWDPTSTALSPW